MTDEKDLYPHITKLENSIGLPQGFIDDLLIESDWSFVVKGHALLEASVATFLTAATNPKLDRVFSFLQLGGGRTSKLAFAEALELLSAPGIGFTRRFSQLRNELVHNVTNVDFSFEYYLDKLSPGDLRSFISEIAAPFPDYVDDLLRDDAILFRRHGKMVAHFSLVAVVTDGHYRLHPAEGSAELEQAMLDSVLGALLVTFAEQDS